jgi:hypothetical protein
MREKFRIYSKLEMMYLQIQSRVAADTEITTPYGIIYHPGITIPNKWELMDTFNIPEDLKYKSKFFKPKRGKNKAYKHTDDIIKMLEK